MSGDPGAGRALALGLGLALALGCASTPAGETVHVVKPGETVYRLSRYYVDQHRLFSRSRSDAIKVAGKQSGSGARRPAAELAAWTMVANALLNLDETLTKE